jgi:hypothetical protein
MSPLMVLVMLFGWVVIAMFFVAVCAAAKRGQGEVSPRAARRRLLR